MRTQYILTIGEDKHEISSEHLYNWDKILCAYSRKDYDGVVRSFTSKFQFVGEAYDLLFEEYLRLGVKAKAVITVFTSTDNWEWEEQFSAPLDFSTISWDGMILSIAAIDNSLAALISSKKSTKYEFEVGKDIFNSGILNFDRVKMQNNVSHEIMDNVEGRGYGTEVSLAHSTNWKRVPTYIIGEAETFENSPISFEDETDDAGSYFLRIEKNFDEVVIETDITFTPQAWPLGATFKGLEIHLKSFTEANPNINDSYSEIGCILNAPENETMTNLGCFASLQALKAKYPNPPQNAYAVIGKSIKSTEAEAVYMTPNTNIPERLEWLQGVMSHTGHRGSTTVLCTTRRYIYRYTIKGLSIGTRIGLFYKGNVGWDNWYEHRDPLSIPITLTSIKTSWESRAKTIGIDALSPTNVAKALLDKIGERMLNTTVHISDFDSRIGETYILAAESVRGIPTAKFYSSFNEFCEWMQAVFGYTYYLGEEKKSKYAGVEPFFYSWDLGNMELTDEVCPSQFVKANNIVYLEEHKIFAILNSAAWKFCTHWESGESCKGDSAYNDSTTGKARLDKAFIDDSGYGQAYYIDSNYKIQVCEEEPSKVGLNTQDVFFCHRSELFKGESTCSISSCKELSYGVDTSTLYGSIEVGYDKQDYETQCGRDEWNFGSSYTTGIDVSEKKLTLKSKYRADCYGLEFLAQKRAQDTTDDKSDNTVFFVLCEETTTNSEDDSEDSVTSINLSIKRGATIEGALSDTVFNGEFSPYHCIKANEGFLASMCQPLTLTFASTDGNGDIKIDGVSVSTNISLTKPLFTKGELSFKSGDVYFPRDVNSLIEVVDKGVTYRGFLTSVEIQYAHEESAKYKLIVKDIEL